ncbi:PsbP domain-containing protein 5, chloroplastic [Tanacetum coccineum]
MRAMETVFSLSHFGAISNHHNFSLTREQAKLSSSNQKIRKINKKFVVCCCESSKPISQNGFYRRDIFLFGIGASVASVFPVEGSRADEEVKMAPIVDDLNAYSYLIPLELPSKKFSFKWLASYLRTMIVQLINSRDGETGGSWELSNRSKQVLFLYLMALIFSEGWNQGNPNAIHLRHLCPNYLHHGTANARLRIVAERVDFIDNLILSVTIGPPNPTFLKSTDKSTWEAKDVADSVLSDKSALRVTSAQKMAESSVLDAHTSEIDGEPYWYYEYLVRKSPTKTMQDSNIFRHYLAASVERDGFLYSLNASTLSKEWDMMGPVLEKTVASFRLLPPTENYVPPGKDPWRFW